MGGGVRGEEAAFRGQDRDVDAVVRSDLPQELGDAEVVVLGHGIELLLDIECYDRDLAAGFVEDGFLWCWCLCHGECMLYLNAGRGEMML